MSAFTPPEETQTKSSPSSFMALTHVTESSIVSPPSSQSIAEMRAPSGTPFGTTSRTSRSTSSPKRMRPFRSPPYSSLRLFEIGEVNAWIR